MKIVKVGDVWVRADLIRSICINHIEKHSTHVIVSIDTPRLCVSEITVKINDMRDANAKSESEALEAANNFCGKLALMINSK